MLFYAYSPRAYTSQVRKVTTYSIMFHLIYLHANLWSLCSGAISCLELVLWNWFCVCLHVQLVVCYRFERAIELKTDNEVCLLCFWSIALPLENNKWKAYQLIRHIIVLDWILYDFSWFYTCQTLCKLCRWFIWKCDDLYIYNICNKNILIRER